MRPGLLAPCTEFSASVEVSVGFTTVEALLDINMWPAGHSHLLPFSFRCLAMLFCGCTAKYCYNAGNSVLRLALTLYGLG